MLRNAVFLDRDGVITIPQIRDGKSYAPRHLADFAVYPEVDQALMALHAADWLLVVVTNQPDIGNGLVDPVVVAAMNERLLASLPITAIKMCSHRQGDGCACRKPKPGMLIEAAAEFGIDMAASIMVGDRWSDIEAGRTAGCRTVFIDRDYTERRPEAPDAVVRSLGEAARFILRSHFPSGTVGAR